MKNRPLSWTLKEKIKNTLKRYSLGRCFFGFLRPVWHNYRMKKARRNMDLHGYEVLRRVHKLLMTNEIPYYCDAGTLLGFVRDGGFLNGDADMDFSILPDYGSLEKVLKIFLAAGYRYIYGYKFNNRLLEFTVMDPKIELTMDFFMSEYCDTDKSKLLVRYLRWFKDRQYPTEKDNTALEFKFSAPKGFKILTVHGVDVQIPINSEQILNDEYGPWKIPDPSFKSDMIPHVEAEGFAHRVDFEDQEFSAMFDDAE